MGEPDLMTCIKFNPAEADLIGSTCVDRSIVQSDMGSTLPFANYYVDMMQYAELVSNGSHELRCD